MATNQSVGYNPTPIASQPMPRAFTAADCADGLPGEWLSSGGDPAVASHVTTDANGVTLYTSDASYQYVGAGKINAPNIYSSAEMERGDYTVHFDIFQHRAAANFSVLLCDGQANNDGSTCGVLGVGSLNSQDFRMVYKLPGASTDTNVATTGATNIVAATTLGVRVAWDGPNFWVWYILDGVSVAMNSGDPGPRGRGSTASNTGSFGARKLVIAAGFEQWRIPSVVRNG